MNEEVQDQSLRLVLSLRSASSRGKVNVVGAKDTLALFKSS